MSATPWIIGGAVVIAGGTLYFLAKRTNTLPGVNPGIAPGTNNTFGSICKGIYATGYQAAGAAYGAPPAQTAGIAQTVAKGTCSLLSTVGSFIGKEVAAGAKYVAPVVKPIGKAQGALLTGGLSLIPGSSTVVNAAVGQTSTATKAQLALSTGGLTLIPGGSTVASKIGSTVGSAAHSVTHFLGF